MKLTKIRRGNAQDKEEEHSSLGEYQRSLKSAISHEAPTYPAERGDSYTKAKRAPNAVAHKIGGARVVVGINGHALPCDDARCATSSAVVDP